MSASVRHHSRTSLLLRSVAIFAVVVVAGGCAWMSQASVSYDGGQPDTTAGGNEAISDDARFVAFTSSATNLLADATGGNHDVYVRDLATGSTERASVDHEGGDANSANHWPDINADGRFVAWHSAASDLVADDTNGTGDVFVRDMMLGVTTRASVDTTGDDSNGTSWDASLSADGTHIAFASWASDLVADDTNARFDVFVRDLVAGVTARVSVDSTGGNADGSSQDVALSENGDFVGFTSKATDLVADDTNGVADAFVRDLTTGTTTRVSLDENGQQVMTPSAMLDISDDGTTALFQSGNDLVGGPVVNSHIYAYDIMTGQVTRVVLDSLGGPPDVGQFGGVLSGDGGLVMFGSAASDLVEGDTNAATDVFVRDLADETTTRVSTGVLAGQGNTSSSLGDITADGRYVAIHSTASNSSFYPGSDPGNDVYVKAIAPPVVESVSPTSVARATTETFTVTGENFTADSYVRAGTSEDLEAGISVDGVTVVSDTELEVTITVDPSAATGPLGIVIIAPGPGQGSVEGSAGLCSACSPMIT